MFRVIARLLLPWLVCQALLVPAVLAEPVSVRRSQMLMGTLVTVTAFAPDERIGQQAATAAFAEIRRLEGLWSTWRPDTELSRVNAAAGREPVAVSKETLDLIQQALEIGRMTGGALNIALGPVVERWRSVEGGRIPSDAELEALRPLTDLSQVVVDEEAGTVFLARRGMRVDVGAIGKGYAADAAADAMQRAGALAGVVAISGDIKTFGRTRDGRPFLFGIQHPRERESILGTLELENEAISTAGDYERYVEVDGVRYHHILDPRTLKPARLCQSVTTVAQDGVLADALDTAIFILGPERGMQLVERLSGLEAVIVDAHGGISVSSGLKARLKLDKALKSDVATGGVPASSS